MAGRRIILIHGAGHGAWCWRELVPLLETRGFSVTAPDLPGLGAHPLPQHRATMAAYVERVLECIDAGEGPSVVLGHSMGGMPISAAAESRPHLVSRLIYLASAIPLDGESLFDMFGAAPAMEDRPATFQPTDDGLMTCPEEWARRAFYNRCPPKLADWAASLLRPQSPVPFGEPVFLTPERWGAVPKSYIGCADDLLAPEVLQDWTCRRVPGIRQRRMRGDHSPFLSAPDDLAAIIDEETR